MQFEWDEAKNEQNITHHGIDFADVGVMFEYLMLTRLDDRFDYGEERWISIGMLGPGYAVVVWTERDEDTIASSLHEGQIKMSADDMKHTSRTNWEKLESQDDSDIDYSDIPPLDDTFFAQAKLVIPNGVRLDRDVLRWFRQHNPNYTEQINEILRQYIEAHEQAA